MGARRGALEHFTIRLTISRIDEIGRTLARWEVHQARAYGGPKALDGSCGCAWRRIALSLEKNCSIGLRSGLYGRKGKVGLRRVPQWPRGYL